MVYKMQTEQVEALHSFYFVHVVSSPGHVYPSAVRMKCLSVLKIRTVTRQRGTSDKKWNKKKHTRKPEVLSNKQRNRTVKLRSKSLSFSGTKASDS